MRRQEISRHLLELVFGDFCYVRIDTILLEKWGKRAAEDMEEHGIVNVTVGVYALSDKH